MPKIRKPSDNITQRTEPQIDIDSAVEAFAANADKTKTELNSIKNSPDAPHNYKSINLPLNKYYFELLDKAAKKERRSKLELLRMAIEKVSIEGL